MEQYKLYFGFNNEPILFQFKEELVGTGGNKMIAVRVYSRNEGMMRVKVYRVLNSCKYFESQEDAFEYVDNAVREINFKLSNSIKKARGLKPIKPIHVFDKAIPIGRFNNFFHCFHYLRDQILLNKFYNPSI